MVGASTSSGSRPQPVPRPGDVVYLLTEIAGGGRIHEIGARGLVVHAGEDSLTVDLGTASRAETVSCSVGQVRSGSPGRKRTAGEARYRAA